MVRAFTWLSLAVALCGTAVGEDRSLNEEVETLKAEIAAIRDEVSGRRAQAVSGASVADDGSSSHGVVNAPGSSTVIPDETTEGATTDSMDDSAEMSEAVPGLSLTALPLAASPAAPAVAASSPTYIYAIDMLTSDRDRGGTDGSAFIRLTGPRGSTGVLYIENPRANDKDPLDRDTYFFRLPMDIGNSVSNLNIDLFAAGSNHDWTYEFFRVYKRVGSRWQLLYADVPRTVRARQGQRPAHTSPIGAKHNGHVWGRVFGPDMP